MKQMVVIVLGYLVAGVIFFGIYCLACLLTGISIYWATGVVIAVLSICIALVLDSIKKKG